MKFLLEQNPFNNPKEVLKNISLETINFQEWCIANPEECLAKISNNSNFYYIKNKGWLIEGDIYLKNKNLTYIPLKFYKVEGDFDISRNPNLKTLKNAPTIINGDLDASGILLVSKEVANYFKKAKIQGDLYLDFNNLDKLINMPKIVNGNFYIYHNPNLKSLEGAPEKVMRDFRVEFCDIQDLGNTLKYVGGNFYIYSQKTKKWTEKEIRSKIEVKRGVHI